jgi:hypothetical protein
VILVALAVYAVLGLITDALVRLLERRALAWRRGSRGAAGLPVAQPTRPGPRPGGRAARVRGLSRASGGRVVLDGVDLTSPRASSWPCSA